MTQTNFYRKYVTNDLILGVYLNRADLPADATPYHVFSSEGDEYALRIFQSLANMVSSHIFLTAGTLKSYRHKSGDERLVYRKSSTPDAPEDAQIPLELPQEDWDNAMLSTKEI